MFALTLGCTSCSNFLDEVPDNRTELNEDNVSKILLAAYPLATAVEIAEMSSDNTDAYPNRFPSADRLQEDLYRWTDSAERSTDSPHTVWEECYMAIASANQALSAVEALGNPVSLDAVRGEALVCRAYAHFVLANTFCNAYSSKAGTDLGVMYVKTVSTTVSPAYERGTLEQTYKGIEADLMVGMDLLSDNVYKVPAYHFTKKAAYAFAARFYLYYMQPDKSNLTKVIDFATKAIGGSVNTALRNWKAMGLLDLNGSVQSNVYVDAANSANLLLLCPNSVWGYVYGAYGRGERYAHGPQVSSTETCQSPGPWKSAYCLGVWDNSSALPTKVMFQKLAQYKKVVDAVAGTIDGYIVNAAFTTDESLLCRAEAYALKGMYPEAITDLNAWVKAFTKTGTPLTVESINDFYGKMNFYEPAIPTVKKALNPDFVMEDGTQENLIYCILHARRVLTVHEGLRWQDVKRYGIVIYRRLFNDNGTITVTDELKVDDPRRAIQIPSDAITAGVKPNPRN